MTNSNAPKLDMSRIGTPVIGEMVTHWLDDVRLIVRTDYWTAAASDGGEVAARRIPETRQGRWVV